MTQFKLDIDYIYQNRVKENYVSLFTIKNIWWVIHQMKYGEEIYPENQFVPYVKKSHENEFIPNTNPGMFGSTPDAIYIFEKAGRTFQFSFQDFSDMDIRVYLTDKEVYEESRGRSIPKFFSYKPSTKITKYDNV